MNTTAIFINVFAFGCLIFVIIKDRAKTKQAVTVALKSSFRILPSVLIIIIFIGLLLGFIPQSQISKIVGEQAGFGGNTYVASIYPVDKKDFRLNPYRVFGVNGAEPRYR